jgi:RNA polymerase sigma factor (sigma-70 family)
MCNPQANVGTNERVQLLHGKTVPVAGAYPQAAFLQVGNSIAIVKNSEGNRVDHKAMNQTSNESTVAAPILGDEEYGRAYRTGYPVTIRFVLARGASPDIAEEIAQAAWVTGWEHRKELRNPDVVCIWVNSIAKNMLLRHFHDSRRLDPISDDTMITTREHSSGLEARCVLNKCRESERALLCTYYLEGHTAEEIAAQKGVTPTTIRVRLLRIRRSLRSRVRAVISNM